MAAPGPTAEIEPALHRDVFEPGSGMMVAAGLADREELVAGNRLAGPALITEAETTVVVPEGFTATVRADGSIEVARAAMQREAAE